MKHKDLHNEENLFDFVEGNLSTEEANTLLQSLDVAENTSLNYWEKANIKDIEIEDYPHQDKLLKSGGGFELNIRNSFFIGLFIGACFWIPFAFSPNTPPAEKEIIIQETAKAEGKQAETIITPDVEKTIVSAPITVKRNVQPKPLAIEKPDQREDIQALTSLELHLEALTYELDRKELDSVKSKHVPLPKTKKELRQEKRENVKSRVVYPRGKGPGIIPMNDLGL